jgi:hypothetical protein
MVDGVADHDVQVGDRRVIPETVEVDVRGELPAG